MTDREQAQLEHERVELAAGRCPYSGLDLEPVHDAWNQDSLMCEMCDCFGYAPDDPRIGK